MHPERLIECSGYRQLTLHELPKHQLAAGGSLETGCRWDSYTTDIDELASAQGEACTLGRQDLLGTKLWKDFDADAAGFPPWAELMPDDDVCRGRRPREATKQQVFPAAVERWVSTRQGEAPRAAQW